MVGTNQPPGAIPPARVEQSTIDDLFSRAIPHTPARTVMGVVVTVDSPGECTVLILDEEVTGVTYDPSMVLRPGDRVEVEVAGDLLTVRSTVREDPAAGLLVAGHIVSDTEPDPPDPELVPISGWLREAGDWVATGWDTVTWLNPGLAVQKAAAAGDARLDSLVPFQVAAGDTVTVTVTEDAATTYDLHVTLALSEEEDADLGDYDTTTGGYTTVSGTPETGEGHYERITFTVPESASGPDGDPPVRGLLLLRFENLATSGTPLTFHSIEVVRQRSEYPMGTLWLNPAHTAHPITFNWNSTEVDTTITAESKALIPGSNVNRVRFPATGSLLLWGDCLAYSTGSQAFNFETGFDVSVVSGAATLSDIPANWREQSTTAASGVYIPTPAMARVRITTPGTVLDIGQWAKMASGQSGRVAVRRAKVVALYLPGVVDSDAAATEIPLRYWNGSEWSYGPPVTTQMYTAGGTPGYTPTTTSLAKSGTALTATVSPGAATGSVQFKNGAAVVATKPLSGGKASHTATTSGTYTAVYLGDGTYSMSESNPQTVTVTTVKSHTVTQNARWVQAYFESGDKLSGTNRDGSWHQGAGGGTPVSAHGNRHTFIGFHRVQDLPGFKGNLVTVTKVRLRLDNEYTHNNGGMTLRLGNHFHTGGSPPNTLPFGQWNRNRSQHDMNKGADDKWFNVTSWADGVVDNSDFGGIVIGAEAAHNGDGSGHGPGALAQCRLEITYDYEEA